MASRASRRAMTEPVFILTAELDAGSFAWLDGLRRAHFPRERNVLSAHLTMFHRLSSSQVARLHTVPLPAEPIPLQFDRVMFLGFGNAIGATSPELERLRANVKAAIGDGLSRQDDQRWAPHVTIQNKTTADNARKLHAEMTQAFQMRAGSVQGLEIFEYLGGPWRLAQSLPLGKARRA